MARLSVSTKKDSAKQSRKELLKKEDAFLSAASDSAVWAQANRQPLIIGASALFLAIIVGVVISTVTESRKDKNAEIFAKATRLLSAQALPAGSTEAAKPDADPPVFATEHDRDVAARDAFKTAAEQTSGKTKQLATFMAANLTAKLGENEAAEKQLTALLNDVPATDSLYFLVVERTAYLQEARGDLAGAVRTLERLKGDAFYADRAAVQSARIAMVQGDTAKARTILEKVKADYPKTPASSEATDLLASMGIAPAPEDGASPASADASAGKAPSIKAD